MKIESHLENLKESLIEIEDAITKGLEEKQRSLGFHTSAAAIDMLEILLHEKNLIDYGFVIKHEWFNSKKRIKEKFSFEFPHKNEIINLISKIEAVRNTLCYGKRQDKEVLRDLIDNFNKLKSIFMEVSKYG
ncbi:hypothetical protein COU57_00955 [Candidatus Pacearchaeota archaeon CG10_big_fil_rev_8_21_14_0_10_32_14]|nr:MAG: hypothetical protein COU57_00955 [Candidatus Pacearchaeota archaeon CG10_big_fil_rev_8_21_14_0_10_32_14]